MKTFQGMIVAALLGAFVAGGAVWMFSRGGLSSDTPDEAPVAQKGDGGTTSHDEKGESETGDGGNLEAKVERKDTSKDVQPKLAGTGLRLPRRPLFSGGAKSGAIIPRGRKLHGFDPDKTSDDAKPPVAPADLAEKVDEKTPESGGTPSKPTSFPARSLKDGYSAILAKADAHFASGETEAGARLVRGVFNQAAHRADVDLSSHVVKLLETDEDPVGRGKYVDYLKRRGEGGRAFDHQLSRASNGSTDESPEGLRKAWTELSRAHDLAGTLDQRTRAYEAIDRLLSRHVFSGRFSPLVETYSVKSGDNLTKIARKYQTTPDAIRRLNGLPNDVIRERMRLRVVPGKVRIVIDKSDFLVWLTVDDRVLLQRPIGLGKDNRTPIGSFVVDSREKNPTWYPPSGGLIAAGDPRNVLGTRWIGFRDTAQVEGIGIHGTVDPSSIGKEMSNGCIRMLNRDVELIFDFVPHRAKVTIRP